MTPPTEAPTAQFGLRYEPAKVVPKAAAATLTRLLPVRTVGKSFSGRLASLSTLSAPLTRIHRRTPMDGVRKAEGGVRELQGK